MRPGLGRLRAAVPALAASGLLVVVAASAWHLWPQARANALAMPAMAQVRAWQAPTAKPPEQSVWLQARATLGRALQIDPHSAELQEAMGYLYVLQAFQPHQGPLLQQAYLEQAVQHLEQATRLRPMVPSSWASLMLAHHQLERLASDRDAALVRRESMWHAFDRALAYGQRDPQAQRNLLVVGLTRWMQLSSQRSAALGRMYAQATPGQQSALTALSASLPKTVAWLETGNEHAR